MSETTLRQLLNLIRRLRSPEGCPWDREQGLEDVRAYLLEEAHEVAAAIDARENDAIAGELGDLLFQVLFAAELLREEDDTTLGEIMARIHRKMVARHPHVFGDEELGSAAEVRRAWESRKARENRSGTSILDGLPASLPSLLAAYRMTQKASGVGFDWPDLAGARAKVDEELAELDSALDRGGEAATRQVEEELGDLLFALANVARHLGVDPERALAATNRKFRRRFGHIERELEKEGRHVDESDLVEMDALWERAKRLER